MQSLERSGGIFVPCVSVYLTPAAFSEDHASAWRNGGPAIGIPKTL
jgi:hypothetical protein